jgi:acyl-CoA synthetase (NDP forming)/GNAT superfamily N-acetyltransferase
MDGVSATADIVLRDGSTVRIRPVEEGDREGLRALVEGLSDRSRWLRFFAGGANLDEYVRWALTAKGTSLVALSGGKIVGHAAAVGIEPGWAEVAFEVADEWQGRGLGTALLGALADRAQAEGIEMFEAEVLPSNHRMIEVFRESGFDVEVQSTPDMLVVRFPTTLSREVLGRFEERDRIAAQNALARFLRPRAVALIGASRTPGSIGDLLLSNLLAAGFKGRLYPVNPNAGEIRGVRCWPSVGELPERVDLAVVAVPAAQVTAVARECAAAGVGALVVISAGFADIGEEGLARQRELLEVCRRSGVRLIGPNCMGVINTDPDVSLDASLAPPPPAGSIGFLSQSGGLGLAIVAAARERGLGLSSFVSVGNKADISGNDLLQYWEGDERTRTILLYLESFGNPRRFARIARRVARSKPIVAVKSGRTSAGMRGSASHTGALIQTSDVTVDALFRQSGVIRTDTLAELFDVGHLLDREPLPTGDRVGIVTNVGGPAIMCADACEALGLSVPSLPEELQARLRGFLPAAAATGNPVDLIAGATAEHYREAIRALGSSDAIDALIVIHIPVANPATPAIRAAIREAAGELRGKLPVLCVLMPHEPDPELTTFAFPEDAARALSHAAAYAAWRREPRGREAELDVRADEAAATIAAALRDEPAWLDPEPLARLLDCYGIPLVRFELAASPEEAAEAAARLGRPVAVKAVAEGLTHKSDVGGVRLGLEGAEAVRQAASEIAERVHAAGHEPRGFLVQPMADEGPELIVGAVQDPSFGAVVACGAGGTTAELLGDVAVRVAPLTDRDAQQMLRSLRTFPLLTGYRGAPKADLAALEDLVLRVASLADRHPEVAELDLNPVIARPDGVAVVDARVRVRAVEARPRAAWPSPFTPR